ncbi:MAG: hypothetical protein AAFQ42_09340 [Pseudomonadota bacterium]
MLRHFATDPRLDAYVERLDAARLVLASALGDLDENAVLSALGRSAVAELIYDLIWSHHAMRLGGKASLFARIYLASVRFDPTLTRALIKSVLLPNGSFEDIIWLCRCGREELGEAENKLRRRSAAGSTSEDLETLAEHRTALTLIEAECTLELGKLDEARALAETIAHAPVSTVLRSRFPYIENNPEEAYRVLERGYWMARDPSVAAEICGEMAEIREEARDFDGALELYRAAYAKSRIQTYNISLNYCLRYAYAAMSMGHWEEGQRVFRDGQHYMWHGYHTVSKISARQRRKLDYPIPEKGALYLGGWGIGDEIIRLAILENERSRTGKFGFYVDPRLHTLAQRSCPDMEFFTASRVTGPHAASDDTFWRDREGVSTTLDIARITNDLFAQRKRFNDICITEDLLYHFVKCGGSYRCKSAAPLFTVDPARLANAQAWLETLPAGKNIGISWRSGMQDYIRDKYYTRLEDWGKILTQPGFNFINLQYSDTTAELSGIADRFGVQIYEQPGLDLMNDIEGVVALCAALDLAIAPSTTVRELAAAAGVTTWALTSTPFLPDLWRIDDDGETDVIFPSMKHITAMDHGSRQGVLDEIARRLAAWPKQHAPLMTEPQLNLASSGMAASP